jgi:thioesterase domain-containing protein
MIEGQKSTSTTVDVLTSIWERVLRRSPIEIDDNFFDLGGDPSSASRIFQEIVREHGRELLPPTIYQAPTIAKLAAVLEEGVPLRFSPVVRLRAGTYGPPVFLFPGVGENVMSFFEPVKHIRTQHPIYGMQAKGVDGVERPFERIEDLCEYYLAAIKDLQPRGPYLLVGYSFGGVVALEIARHLTEGGDDVGLLAMIDSYPPLEILKRRQFLKVKVIRQKHHIATMIQELLGSSRHHRREQKDDPPVEMPRTQAMQRLQEESDYRTLGTFQRRFYNGTIRFIKAGDDWVYPLDPKATWARWAKEVRIETAPGDHVGVIRTHYDSLGSMLSRYLQEADR